jgi:cell division protein FtsW (lipid II flippase)
MATFLIFCLCFGVGVLYAGVRERRYRLLWGGALFLALAITVAPMNGSRSVLFFTAIPVPVVLYEMMVRQGRRARGLVAVAAALTLAVVATQTDTALAWEIFFERVDRASDTEGRAVGLVMKPLSRLGEAGLFGYGAGSTHQAAPALAGAPNSTWLPFGRGESTFARLMTELGALGFLIIMSLKLYLVYFAYRTMRDARSAFAAVMGTTAFLFLTVHLVAHVAFNPTAGALYWTLVGATIYGWSRDRVEEGVAQRIRHDQPQPA